VDVIATGDYQAAEKKFEVSRRMLEVCLELGFPVSVLERSPLVLRDLDLLKEINQRAPSVVFFSMISAPDSPTYERIRQMENLAPAWKSVTRHGADCQGGYADRHQHDADPARPVRHRREPGSDHPLHGQSRRPICHRRRPYLADQQRDYFFGILGDRFPDLLPLYERMYPHPTASYGGIRSGDPHAMGRRIRDLCRQYGISDRMPRRIIPATSGR